MVARIAGYSAELLDRFLGKLGKPVGVATYKPCNSVGEAYLPNYLGTIGIPMDLVAEFPAKSATVLLTAASRFDKDLVAKVKKHVQAGGRVIATTGLIEALGEKGFQDIAEIEVTGHRVMATRFPAGRGGVHGRTRRRGASPGPRAGAEHHPSADAMVRERRMVQHPLQHRPVRVSDGDLGRLRQGDVLCPGDSR